MEQSNHYNQVIKYDIVMKCVQPLHIGSWNGNKEELLIHPLDGKPFIQAYSLAGALRAYCGNNIELFGGESQDGSVDYPSRVKVTDACIHNDQSLHLEFRPHVKINSRTGSVDEEQTYEIASGTKFQMQYVSTGTEFRFEVYYYHIKTQHPNILTDQLLESILAIHNGEVRFGARKSTGCGKCQIVSLKQVSYDLTNADDRVLWYQDSMVKAKDLQESLKISASKDFYVAMKGKVADSLLIKSIGVIPVAKKIDTDDLGGLVTQTIRNGQGDSMIPGSSIKGVIRNRAHLILKYLNLKNKEQIERTLFGEAKQADNQGIVGNARFEDCLLHSVKEQIQPRIHIDKFTGGAKGGELFLESIINGEVEVGIHVSGKGGEVAAKQSVGLLLMVLRDFALGLVGFGSGAGIGRGFIDVDEIFLSYEGRKEVIKVTDKKLHFAGSHDLIDQCLNQFEEG